MSRIDIRNLWITNATPGANGELLAVQDLTLAIESALADPRIGAGDGRVRHALHRRFLEFTDHIWDLLRDEMRRDREESAACG